MNHQHLIDPAELDSGLQEELAEHSANLAWSLFTVAAIVCAFLAWNALDLRNENFDLRDQVKAMQGELDAKRAYDDSWTCINHERAASPHRPAALMKSCIRTVEAF